MEPFEKINKVITENNYLDTVPGQRFKEWNDIKDIQAVISFGGRSKNQQSYPLELTSESETEYITHLYIDKYGEMWAKLSTEDDDDYSKFLESKSIRLEILRDDILEALADLLIV